MPAPEAKEKSVDEGMRMRLNGETKRLMAWAQEAKSRVADTSVDEPWEVDSRLCIADLYTNVVTIPYMLLKGLVLFPIFLIVQLPVIAMCHVRASFAPRPCDALDRTHWGHHVWFVCLFVVALPMLFFALVSYVVDMILYYFFSVLYCTLSCNWCNYCKSQAVLDCFRGGPSLLSNLSDGAVALVDAINLNTFLKADLLLAAMWIAMPWFKYFQNANPFIYPLEHRFITQISTSVQDLTVPQLMDNNWITKCKLEDRDRKMMRKWHFLPAYAEPPSWKRWAVGMQMVGDFPIVGTTSFLMVHTTHAKSRAGGVSEQLCLSNSSLVHKYRVMLWYNNPYHLFTGWVEANISTGAPSQLDKPRGLEHPMWLVGIRSPKHCNRKAYFSAGKTDSLFDKWLPGLVNYHRGLHYDEAYTQSLAEGVVSKDGVSRPAQGKEVPYVPPYPEAADV